MLQPAIHYTHFNQPYTIHASASYTLYNTVHASSSYTLSQPCTAQAWSVKGEYSISVHLYKRGGRVGDEGGASPADRAAGVSYSHPHHSTAIFINAHPQRYSATADRWKTQDQNT